MSSHVLRSRTGRAPRATTHAASTGSPLSGIIELVQEAHLRTFVLFAISLAVLSPGMAQQPKPEAPKLQALIITGQNGHNWRSDTPVLRQLLEDTGRFEVRVTEEFRGGGPETLAPYDVVILN